MRRITKDAIHCKECGSQLRSEEYDCFCDRCDTKIMDEKSGNIYQLTIFWKDRTCGCNDTEHLEFCSLKCCREWLLDFPMNKKMVDFISLPAVHNVDDLKIFLNGNEK